MELGFFTIWPIVFALLFGAVGQEMQTVSVKSSTPATTVAGQPAATTAAATTTPVAETPVVTGAKETGLAKCLTAGGAKFFGAYWCPHCAEQKKLLGDTLSLITYVECDAKGTNPNPEACKAAGIQGYPTWKMAGKQDLTGSQSFTQLAAWSGCSY
jgi:hypothetical protein